VQPMQRLALRRAVVAGLLAVMLLLAVPLTARSNTVERSLDEFLAAQGTFCITDGEGGCLQFFAPLPNMLGFPDEARNRCAMVDYAGLAHRYLRGATGGELDLGTEISGSVQERPAPDAGAPGTVEITVRLKIRDALIYSVTGCDLSAGPAEFGSLVPEILAGAEPTVGNAELVVKFITTAPGRPLPDLIEILVQPEFGQTIRSVRLDARADGDLRSPFGVPDGTSGKASIRYTGGLDGPVGEFVEHGDILLSPKP